MAKLIVERPRTGGGVGFPRASGPDDTRLTIDDWKSREGIRRPWLRSSYTKHLNENLAPLRRYLRSNVGRPWSKVYGEVCQRINRDSAVQLHVWQHLMQDVCTNPYVISGDLGPRWRFGLPYRFYVDPRNGVLREAKSMRRKPRGQSVPEADDRIDVDETHQLRRIDGIWYEPELADIPADTIVFDLGTKRTCTSLIAAETFKFYGRAVYATRKRQLNKREIRRLVPRAGSK